MKREMSSAHGVSVFVVICDPFPPLSSLFIPFYSTQVPRKRNRKVHSLADSLGCWGWRFFLCLSVSLSPLLPIVGSNWDTVHGSHKMQSKHILKRCHIFHYFATYFSLTLLFSLLFFSFSFSFYLFDALFATFLNNSPLNHSQCVFCRNVKSDWMVLIKERFCFHLLQINGGLH